MAETLSSQQTGLCPHGNFSERCPLCKEEAAKKEGEPRGHYALDADREFLGFRKVEVTKVDETRLLGGALNAASWSGLPLVYLTCGQRVPEDLEEVDARTLGSRILRGEVN